MNLNIGKISSSARIKLGALLLLALTALLINLIQFIRHKDFELRARQDEITLYEQQFEELKKALPARGVVGYVSDETDVTREMKEYYLTQYTLAPVLVVKGTQRSLVVGNFRNASKGSPAPIEGLALRKDFGNGVVLFVNETR